MCKNVVFIISTEATLNDMGYNFIDISYNAFRSHNEEYIRIKQMKIDNYVRIIKNDKSWLKSIKDKALNNNIQLEEQILRDAEWMVNRDEL